MNTTQEQQVFEQQVEEQEVAEQKQEEEQEFSYETEEGEENVSYPHLDEVADREPCFVVENKWAPIRVLKIDDIKVINQTYYEETKDVFLAGIMNARKSVNMKGMLRTADLELTMTLEESVAPSLLSVHVDTASSIQLTSKVAKVMIGKVAANELSSFEPLQSQFKIIVPLTKGLNDSIPLFDQFHSLGKHVIHHNIQVFGCTTTGKDSCHYVRVKVCEVEGTVDVVSVTQNVVDIARITESLVNAKEAAIISYNALVEYGSRLFGRARNGLQKNKVFETKVVDDNNNNEVDPAKVSLLSNEAINTTNTPVAVPVFVPATVANQC